MSAIIRIDAITAIPAIFPGFSDTVPKKRLSHPRPLEEELLSRMVSLRLRRTAHPAPRAVNREKEQNQDALRAAPLVTSGIPSKKEYHCSKVGQGSID